MKRWKSRPLLNCELTRQALDFIYHEGRNTLDCITQEMTVQEQIAAGWRRHDKPFEVTYQD